MNSRLAYSPAQPHGRLAGEIDRWLCAAPMQRLVSLFGGGSELQFSPDIAFYESLVEFVDRHWNSRGAAGTERYATSYREVPSHLVDQVMSIAKELGLIGGAEPGGTDYDVIIAPGTQLWSMILRVGHMRGLQRRGVSAQRFVGLGSHRVLAPQEVRDLADFGLSGSDEYSLMCSVFGTVFGARSMTNSPSGPTKAGSPFIDSRTDAVADAGRTRLTILSTSKPDGTRPNTYDTFRAWAQTENGGRKDAARVLVVTQPLYLYQQGAAAIEILGLENGLDVEVIGATEAEHLPGFKFPAWTADRILQEVNGSVKRLVALRSRLALGQIPEGRVAD